MIFFFLMHIVALKLLRATTPEPRLQCKYIPFVSEDLAKCLLRRRAKDVKSCFESGICVTTTIQNAICSL